MRLPVLAAIVFRVALIVIGVSRPGIAQGNISDARWLTGTWAGEVGIGGLGELAITLIVKSDGSYTYRTSGRCEVEHDGYATATDAGTERRLAGPLPVAIVRFQPTRIRKEATGACAEDLQKRRVLANSAAQFRIVNAHQRGAIEIYVRKDDTDYWSLDRK